MYTFFFSVRHERIAIKNGCGMNEITFVYFLFIKLKKKILKIAFQYVNNSFTIFVFMRTFKKILLPID